MGEFTVTVDGEDHLLKEDNHTVAMFRQTPEYDYIHLRPEDDPVDEQRNILIFRNQRLCHWLANLALNGTDQAALEEMNEELGEFGSVTGFNSKTLIEDSANEFEVEFYTDSLMNDLKEAEGVPDEWI